MDERSFLSADKWMCHFDSCNWIACFLSAWKQSRSVQWVYIRCIKYKSQLWLWQNSHQHVGYNWPCHCSSLVLQHMAHRLWSTHFLILWQSFRTFLLHSGKFSCSFLIVSKETRQQLPKMRRPAQLVSTQHLLTQNPIHLGLKLKATQILC